MLNLAESSIQEGINYAVPTAWWKKFRELHSTPNPSSAIELDNSIEIATINTYPIIDSILVDFEEDIVNQLAEKSNNLYVHKRFISPMLLPTVKLGEDFHLVSSRFWHQLASTYPANYPIITFAFKEYDLNTTERVEKINGLTCPIAQRQVQIVFCTDRMGILFIGFLPQNADLLSLIRLVMKELRLIERPESKISFLEVDPQSSTRLSKFAPRYVKDLNERELFIMVINLLSENENTLEQQLNISTQALNKSTNLSQHPIDVHFFQETVQIHRPDHKTISTGASTPLTFSIDSDRHNECEFQLVQMLRQKSQQQIDELRKRADMLIEGELIMVDHSTTEQAMKQQLQIVADQIIEMVSVHKKKIKEKDYY